MTRVFWIIAAVFTALAVHSSIIVAAPGYSYGRAMTRLAAQAGFNAFFIMPSQAQTQLFPTYPRESVIGLCVFDVSAGDVQLSAQMPPGFWTLTVYSSTGAVIYSVNDRQAGTGSFTLSLSRAPGFVETLLKAAEKEKIEEDSGWTVKTVDPKGLAVLWYPEVETAMRPHIIREMKASTCTQAG